MLKKVLKKVPGLGTQVKKWEKGRQIKTLRSDLHKTPPVLIYQFGKVGSSTLNGSISKQYDGVVMATHNIENGFDWRTDILNEEFQKHKMPMKILSPIREPIGRNLSAFFENFERIVGTKYEESQHSEEELMELFLQHPGNNFPITFFDNHIYKHFGIDVYQSPFPDEGYTYFKKDGIDLLVMRHDLKTPIKNKIIGNFIGNSSFKILGNRNVTAKKKYAEDYTKMQQLNFPENYIEKMLNNKFAQHFYLKDVGALRQKWIR